ncbi:uncharacterized protein LOC131359209 isoform X2 [Hemibagrus wyckioides]|uniref:uncharacterized protein LOC131359209 isoform X2 n=1 Tax=Hemibagrus wyckioides TaxID=337641 RepID=UPI00266BF8B4|nr:uncharacterized protein LOC131359209 isoform X2 [Hemibagrus wyckioides]
MACLINKHFYGQISNVTLMPYSGLFFSVGREINPVLDAKKHVCARRDKSHLESRFINIIKGYGVFATTRIEEGSFIVEYRGVLRDAAQCVPDAYSYYFIYNNTRYCIDASVDDGSLGRLVNDDINPNAKVKVISINRIPHLCLFALRDIQPGEEITYDYGGYDLPWRRGTWLCMENSSQFDNNEETLGQHEQEPCTEEITPSQTVNKECEEVPVRADKATQTTDLNTSLEDMIWNYIPYQCLTSEHQKLCETQLLQIQLTPLTLQQIAEQQQTSMDVEPCVKEQSCPVSREQLPCDNEGQNQPLCSEDSPAVNQQPVSDAEMTSSNEEEPESQLANQMTDEVRAMECNEDAEQTLEQKQTSLQQVEQCEEEQSSSSLSAAQSTCDEKQLECQDQPCQIQEAQQMQAGEETQQQCNNDSSQTQSATQSAEADSNLSSEESNDDTVSSDEEFIPVSETESDDDSDIEKPKKKAKTTDASKETEEPATPPVQNHSVIKATKLNFCLVCGKACVKISRHLKVHIKDNVEIATAFKLRKNSKQRSHMLEVLRNKGNYQHNSSVVLEGVGLLKTKRKPKADIDTQKFEYCMYCKGLFVRKTLWMHVRRCASNPERDMPKTSRSVLGLAAFAQCTHLKHVSEDVKKMLCDMHQDEVAQVVRNDEYVLKLAQDFYDKKGNSKERHAFVRQTIRCIGKFLVLLRNKYEIRNLAEAIKPSSFTTVIQAVKEIAEFNEETQRYAIPGLARRIGLVLRKYCILSAQKAFAIGDKILIRATSTFMDLFNNAHFALVNKRCLNIQPKFFLLPFVNNVRIFHCYLEKASQCAMKALRETPSAQTYADLCKVTLAQILMFNRRQGEVSQMTIKRFQERDQVQAPEISEVLTELEKVCCEQYCKILVHQKVGVLVPVILTSDMIDALLLLTEKREQCGVPNSNIFVFGQPRNNKCYRGENALRICANECDEINPDNLTSTKFSAHISTLTQFLTLKNHELKKLAKFIGHDISLRKEYYRQSEAVPRLAKICKLILAIEKGSAAEVIGQSLDDIELPEEIRESDSEDEYFEEDYAFLENRATRRELALQLLCKSKNQQKNCSASALNRRRRDNKSTSKKNESASKENESTSKDNESTSKRNESSSKDNESTSKDIASTSKDIASTSKDNESTSKDNESTSKDNESTSKDIASTSKEQDTQSTEDPKAKKPAQEQAEEQVKTVKKRVQWTREERMAIMKHFKKQIYHGRLATVYEARRCKLLEQPVLDGRTIQKIRDFVRNCGKSLKRKMASKNSSKMNLEEYLDSQLENPNSPTTDTSTSSQLSSQTANPLSSIVTPSPATDLIKPIILFSQNANVTTTTTLPPQVTLSTTPNVAHPQANIIYVKVKNPHSANQTTATLPLPLANQTILPAKVILPQTVNPSKILQVADLTNSSILIPQVPNQRGLSKPPPQAAPLICSGVLVPQAANPATYVLTPPAAKPESSNRLPPQISILKCVSVPLPQGAHPNKS